MTSEYRICTRCLMDTSDPEIVFDERGVCNHCHDYDRLVAQKVLGGEAGQKYLERLVGILRRQELVRSFKGKVGGYALARHPRLIKVGEIVETLDGAIAPMGCASPECKAIRCRPKKVWINLGKLVHDNLYSIKLSDLIR